MLERRAGNRNRSFLKGRVLFNNRLSSIDCIIRDINDHGARLTFGSAVSVPEVFELAIPNKDETFRAHVAWHHGAEIGVAFETEKSRTIAEADASQNALAERVDRLEKDVTALKRRMEQLRPSD